MIAGDLKSRQDLQHCGFAHSVTAHFCDCSSTANMFSKGRAQPELLPLLPSASCLPAVLQEALAPPQLQKPGAQQQQLRLWAAAMFSDVP
jgi:hypothetical protein